MSPSRKIVFAVLHPAQRALEPDADRRKLQTDLHALNEQTLEKWLRKYRLGHLFTRGDLESLAMPEVESLSDINERFADLPSEGQAMADLKDSG